MLLCVVLILFVGTMSVVHGHSDHVEHPDCGLCMTSHVSVLAVAEVVLITVPQIFERVELSLPVAPCLELVRFALFTRPPPANAYLS